MTIAVIGAGAIGGLVAGYLKLHSNHEVVLIGRPDAVGVIAKYGLHIKGVRGNFDIPIKALTRLDGTADVVVLATKIQDIESALYANRKELSEATILTTQNGIHADAIAAQLIPKERIVSSIVMFGATYLRPGEVTHNFDGSWVIGNMFGKNDAAVAHVKDVIAGVFPVVVSEEIRGMKYLKIFVNANNCIPAILGMSMQEAFSDPALCSISISLWKEGLRITEHAGIALESLPDFPLERLKRLANMPLAEAAGIFSGIMKNLSIEPLYGSILQSIKRQRDSEIDYINGEFVDLAKKNSMQAPLNAALVKMVHEVERTQRFFTKKELLEATQDL